MSDYGQGYGQSGYGDDQGAGHDAGYDGGYGADYGEPYAPRYGDRGYDYSQTEPLPEPAAGGSNKRILTILGGVIVVCVVLLVLALLGVFDFGSKTSGSPRAAATALLEAGKNHDVDAARKVLCAKDLTGGTAGTIASTTIESYSIDAVAQSSSTATVTATIISGSANTVIPLPVVKENGAWKVCLPIGATIGPSGSATATPTSGSTLSSPPPSVPVSTPVPSASVPSVDIGNLNVCQSSTTAQMTAQLFVGALALGSADLAQGCVFNNAVPAATIDAIAASDTLYSQVSASGSTFVFQSTDGAKKLTVQVTKEPDGKFYVTGLTQS